MQINETYRLMKWTGVAMIEDELVTCRPTWTRWERRKYNFIYRFLFYFLFFFAINISEITEISVLFDHANTLTLLQIK